MQKINFYAQNMYFCTLCVSAAVSCYTIGVSLLRPNNWTRCYATALLVYFLLLYIIGCDVWSLHCGCCSILDALLLPFEIHIELFHRLLSHYWASQLTWTHCPGDPFLLQIDSRQDLPFPLSLPTPHTLGPFILSAIIIKMPRQGQESQQFVLCHIFVNWPNCSIGLLFIYSLSGGGSDFA